MSKRKEELRKIKQHIEERDKPIRDLSYKLFPEVYDCIYDDGVDADLRRKGINPMRQEYIDWVNKRRRYIGVKPYGLTQLSPKEDMDAVNDDNYLEQGAFLENIICFQDKIKLALDKFDKFNCENPQDWSVDDHGSKDDNGL
jgi:hypothetical protein